MRAIAMPDSAKENAHRNPATRSARCCAAARCAHANCTVGLTRGEVGRGRRPSGVVGAASSRPSRTASAEPERPPRRRRSPARARRARPTTRRPRVDHGDLEDEEHEDPFPDGGRHARQFNPTARPHPNAAVANTSLTLQPLGCPELFAHPSAAFLGRSLVRRIVRLVIVLSVLAGVAAPTTFAAQRMWVGFHDDPSFRWVLEPQALVQSRGAATTRRSSGCSSSGTSPRRRARRTPSTRSTRRTSSTTSTRPYAPRRQRPGSHPHDLGDAALGQRRQDPERHAQASRRLRRLRARDRVALLRSLRGLSVRPLLVDLERAEPSGLPHAAVRQRGPLRRARELREARRGRVRGPQGGEPASAGRDRRDVRARQRQGRTGSGRRTRPASSPSSSRRRTRG